MTITKRFYCLMILSTILLLTACSLKTDSDWLNDYPISEIELAAPCLYPSANHAAAHVLSPYVLCGDVLHVRIIYAYYYEGNGTTVDWEYGAGLYRVVRKCNPASSQDEPFYCARNVQLIDTKDFENGITFQELFGTWECPSGIVLKKGKTRWNYQMRTQSPYFSLSVKCIASLPELIIPELGSAQLTMNTTCAFSNRHIRV